MSFIQNIRKRQTAAASASGAQGINLSTGQIDPVSSLELEASASTNLSAGDFVLQQQQAAYKQAQASKQKGINNGSNYLNNGSSSDALSVKPTAQIPSKAKIDTMIKKSQAANSSTYRCSECKSEGIITNSKQGVTVCSTCGLVISSRIIDESAEWRNFGESDSGKADMNRVGGRNNPFISTGGLDTNIKGSNASQYSKWMDKNNFISLTSKDKTIMKGIHYIEDICTRLNIMDGTTKKACEILKKVDEMELVKGQKLNTKCGTIIFIACRMTKNNTNVRDIFKATNMGHKELSKCFKRLKPAIPGQQISETSGSYAEQAAKKLGLDEEVIDICKATAENISKLEVLTGKKPATIAGVAIYMIVQLSQTLSEQIDCAKISSILGMGETAIKMSYKEVEDLKSDILPIGFQPFKKSQSKSKK